MSNSVKQFFFQHLPNAWINAPSGIKQIIQGDYPVMQRRLYNLEKRVTMAAQYQINQTALHATSGVRNPLNAHERSVHSQNGEDGILLNLFTQIGTTNQKFVELGIGNGRECTVTIPYVPDFDRYQHHPSGFYHGASLAALYKLGQEKGYSLVGCDSMGTNAFFVRQDADCTLTSLSVNQVYFPSAARNRYGSITQQFQLITDLPLMKV